MNSGDLTELHSRSVLAGHVVACICIHKKLSPQAFYDFSFIQAVASWLAVWSPTLFPSASTPISVYSNSSTLRLFWVSYSAAYLIIVHSSVSQKLAEMDKGKENVNENARKSSPKHPEGNSKQAPEGSLKDSTASAKNSHASETSQG